MRRFKEKNKYYCDILIREITVKSTDTTDYLFLDLDIKIHDRTYQNVRNKTQNF